MKMRIELKKEAFDYIMYKMMVWYITFNKMKSSDEFNAYNDFSMEKVRFLPFIICMASLEREKMLTFFDNIFASDDGMLERDLLNYPFNTNTWKKLRLEKYQFFYHSLGFKVDDLEGNSLDLGCKKVLISKKTFCEEGVPYQLIDEAIEHLKECNKHFVNHDAKLLGGYSRRHSCWNIWYQMQMISSEYQIPFEQLLTTKSYFSAKRELLRIV